jgi:hypothetical protein
MALVQIRPVEGDDSVVELRVEKTSEESYDATSGILYSVAIVDVQALDDAVGAAVAPAADEEAVATTLNEPVAVVEAEPAPEEV